MSKPAEIIRIHIAVNVLILKEKDGISIVKACRELGIARSTFYNICQAHPDIVANIQERLERSNREQLAAIIDTRMQVLNTILEEALAETTSPMERLAIFNAMEKLLEKLKRELRLDELANEEAAAEVLAGPILTPAKSRFTTSPLSRPDFEQPYE